MPLRKGNDCVAAGFLVFAIGESLLASGTAAGLAAPLLFFAYPFLVVTFVGWILALVKGQDVVTSG